MKKYYTLEDIRKAEQGFIPCPFCRERPKIVFADDEGNRKGQDDEEYLQNPWSGLTFRVAHPARECPVATDDRDYPEETYQWVYDNLEDAVKDWNDSLKKHGGNNYEKLVELVEFLRPRLEYIQKCASGKDGEVLIDMAVDEACCSMLDKINEAVKDWNESMVGGGGK